MILIADSGSTKTSWALCSKYTAPEFFTTIGYNPYFISVQEITLNLSSTLPNSVHNEAIEEIFFFGAGCTSSPSQIHIKTALECIFPKAKIQVDSDLLAACIALFGNNKGIACILGTGSNAGVFDGKHFSRPTKSLGYVLGDEGSAAYIGKVFLNNYLRDRFEPKLKDFFDNRIGLDEEAIIDKVYRQPFPNRFLASLLPIIVEQKSDKHIHQLLTNSIENFITHFVFQIPHYQDFKTGFCGGTAYILSDFIHELCLKHAIQFDTIIKQPIDELVKFYSK